MSIKSTEKFAASPISSQNKGVPENPKVLLIPIFEGWQSIESSQIVGVDSDADRIDQARQLAERLGRVDCLFIYGDAEQIPWRDDYFEEAYLEQEATAEIKRVLTKSAVIHKRLS